MTRNGKTPPVDELITSLCATIPNYPKPGIVFKDLTPVFADGAALRAVVNALVAPFEGRFDAVAGELAAAPAPRAIGHGDGLTSTQPQHAAEVMQRPEVMTAYLGQPQPARGPAPTPANPASAHA